MIDDEIVDEFQPDLGSDVPVNEDEPVQELPSEDEPSEQLPAEPPMVVIPVEDLTELLDEYFSQEDSDEESEEDEEPSDEQEEVDDSSENIPASDSDPISVFMDVDLSESEDQLSALVGILDHPALTTPFEDYTVTEALLLFLLLAVFVLACARMLRGVFSWLRS